MQRYVGTKVLLAMAMTRGEYNTYRGWSIPTNEDPAEAGFLVEYQDQTNKRNDPRHDNYISWLPADVFNKNYHQTDAMPFGEAVALMKKGYKVARRGWNGKDMWITIGKGNIGVAADDLWNAHAKAFAVSQGGRVHVQPYILMKTAQDNIQMGWSPSQSDVLAEDWHIAGE